MDQLKIGSIVNNEFVFGGEEVDLLSPSNGEVIGKVFQANRDLVKSAIESADSAYHESWIGTDVAQRQKLLSKLYERVLERLDQYATAEALNTGRTMRQSLLMDLPISADHLNYFATEKEFKSSRQIEHPDFPGTKGEVQNAPFGVVGAIAPWNVPLMMAIWKVVPALLAGNTVVLKPSHYTPVSSFELVSDMVKVGFPPGVINLVPGTGKEVGEELVKNNKVRLVSFTGSTKTGKDIIRDSSAGVKKVVLELGGKSPTIVFEDCDFNKAVRGVLFSIYLHMGQLCESGSRLIVHDSIKDKFVRTLAKGISAMRTGNPMDMETDVGSITTREQLGKIHDVVEEGISEGANPYYVKEMNNVPSKGFFYPPTILNEVTSDMIVYREEIFGPVLTVTGFNSEDEAVNIANDSRYGLAAAIWTQDMEKARRVGSRLEAGTVWINQHHLPSAAAPRGGFKDSGIGRELGIEGIMEYTQTRHLFINDKGIDFDDVAPNIVVSDLSFLEES